MSKERRLGRGLEALLGRAPRRVEEPTIHLSEGTAAQRRVDAPHLDNEVVPTDHLPVLRDDENQDRPKGIAEQAAEDARMRMRAAMAAAGTAAHEPGAGAEGDAGVIEVDVRLIEGNPYQPRHDFDDEEMDGLAGSIADHGMLQPLVVRRVDESYQLIAGERRLRAAQKAGLLEVPVKVVEADDRRMAELALVENLQRKDLGPLEKAEAFERYLSAHGGTQFELAARLRIDRSTLANLLRLLELPRSVRDLLAAGAITQGHARALLPLGDEDLQRKICDQLLRDGLSVRQTEELVERTIQEADAEPLAELARPTPPPSPRPAPTPKDDQIAALEQEFRSALGAKVRLTHNARGRGRLVIHFRNHEEFERLRGFLVGRPVE